jgi:site-specific DNA recombinase
MKDTKLRYIAYLRKSEERDDYQELSTQSQQRKIEEQFPDLNIIDYVIESGSAFKPNNRPLFEAQLRRIEKGEADGLIGWHPNRFSRNEIDAAAITYRVRTGVIKDLKFCTFNFDNSAEGIMMLQMALSQSQYESAKQGRDVKRGMEEKAAVMGERPGQVPQGYIKKPILDEQGRMVKKGKKIATRTEDDVVLWPLVERMWKMLLSGSYTPAEIRKKANEEWKYSVRETRKTGGQPMGYSTIYRIFGSPFYAGFVEHNGQRYPGKHHAMITPDEFDYAQTLLATYGKKTAARLNVHEYAYAGLIVCGECGCSIVGKTNQKKLVSTGSIKTYVHYYCTRKSLLRPCNQTKYTSVDKLELEIDAELSKYTILPEFRDIALEILNREHKVEVKDRTTIYKSQQQRQVKVQEQIDKLTNQLTRGIVDEDDYIRQRDSLKQQLNEASTDVRSTEQRAGDWLELTEKAFNFATYARANFANGDFRTRKNILMSLGTNLQLKDNKLSLTPNPWLVPIEMEYKSLEVAFSRVRTNKKASLKEKNEAFGQIFESWRARWDSNPRHSA